MAKLRSELEAEVERLKEELGQLELHVERVDTWTKYIGKWTAHISSSDVKATFHTIRPLVSLFDNFLLASGVGGRRKESDATCCCSTSSVRSLKTSPYRCCLSFLIQIHSKLDRPTKTRRVQAASQETIARN